MTLTTWLKHALNTRVLNPLNLRLETLTAERREGARLEALTRTGHFASPVFPVTAPMAAADPREVLTRLAAARTGLRKYAVASTNTVGYTFDNAYFSSPDAEVLQVMLQAYTPRVYLEIGSGNSTKIARQTVQDYQLRTEIWCVDPEPRTEIGHLADRVVRARVETLDGRLFADLDDGDILFIDSSHRLGTGNDVAYLYLTVLPALRPGVLVHIHDILLPFDYPTNWVVEHRWDWNEQYLVQAILSFSDAFEVLWAGHYLQHTLGDFASHFEHLGNRRAQSLWLRKIR